MKTATWGKSQKLNASKLMAEVAYIILFSWIWEMSNFPWAGLCSFWACWEFPVWICISLLPARFLTTFVWVERQGRQPPLLPQSLPGAMQVNFKASIHMADSQTFCLPPHLGWQLWILTLGLAQTIHTCSGTVPYCSPTVAKEPKETRWSGSFSTWNLSRVFTPKELGWREVPIKGECKVEGQMFCCLTLGDCPPEDISWDLLP